MIDFTYLLPIRRDESAADAEFTEYLRFVASHGEVIVVDGSIETVFEEHARNWSEFTTHIRPDPQIVCLNGKVRGVVTGLAHASNDRVVVADDDVRYDELSLRRVLDLLDCADVVAPQNYFQPTPWHALWDTARTLVNRAFGWDPPGTLALRRSALPMARYDGDVLFENLELMRTVAAFGGRVHAATDCYVRRLPPSAAHFASQRVRQAYDELARPHRFVAALCVIPTLFVLARKGARPFFSVTLGAPVIVAMAGRARARGRCYFDRKATLFAPIWVAERGICAWVALWWRLRTGCPYGAATIKRAAHSRRELRQMVDAK
jgi:hypothetical protein